MVRELQVTNEKSVNAMCKCGETKIMTGMGVIKVENTKTFEFPSAETASDIYIAERERDPRGINAARKDMSDYDEDFTTIYEGEYGKLIHYIYRERFAVDQFTGEISSYTVGDRLSVGTDGKWKKAGSTVASKYVFQGEYLDNGHSLILIEVSDTPAKNA